MREQGLIATHPAGQRDEKNGIKKEKIGVAAVPLERGIARDQCGAI